MKKSLTAALLSGLIFPGLGHLYIQHRRRGWTLILTALVPASIIVCIAVQDALTVVDSILSGDTAMDTTSIERLVEASPSGSDDLISTACVLILGACWLFGIVDSYRLGAEQDKLSNREG